MFKASLLFITLLFAGFLYAQKSTIFFDHFGLSAGFTSREAMDIVTASNGMVWISSNDGLVRFDSKRFKFYQHIQGDSNSLTNNYCKAMVLDKRGHIWIQSDDNLDVFDPATEKFAHFKFTDTNNKQTPVYPLGFFYDSTADIMWVGTAQGLFFSRNGSRVLQSASTITAEKMLVSGLINTIASEGRGVLWITSRSSIIRLNTKSGLTEKYEVPERVDGFNNRKEFFEFKSSMLDRNRTLWLGSWVHGLVEFNTLTKRFHQYCFQDYTKAENTIFDIAQTREQGQENTLWLSTPGYGLTSFDMITHKFTCYNTSLANSPFGVKGNTYGLFSEKGKGLWIGSETGLHRYDYSKQIFAKIDLAILENGSGLPPVSRMAIQKSKTGQDEILWFYVSYKGGYLYNLSEKQILPLPPKIARYINMPTTFLGFFIDSKNILWISSIEYGLIGYEIEGDKIIFTEETEKVEKLDMVSCLFEDSKNRLWIGSYDGLHVMDTKGRTITAAVNVNNYLREKGLARIIEDITEDETGNIWFTADGTDEPLACIGKLNPANNRLELMYNERNEQQINRGPVGLRNIVSNHAGKIFVSFYGEGVAWFSSEAAAAPPQFLTRKNGLNSTCIGGLLADNRGNIWCNTSFGLSVYRLVQNQFFNYSYASYAMDNTAEPAIYLSPQSGTIYIGQSGAIRYFNQSILNKKDTKIGNLVFSEIKILNKPFYPEGKLLTHGDIIKLTHKQDMVSIEFALLSFTNAEDNTYSWKLQGWEEDWNTSTNNIATYINLEPGTYTLWVKAANNQGDWTKEPIKLTLKIAYPFYQTWWFILLCGLGLAALVYWFVQLRIRRIQEKYQLRNKIAADLHDEIGSTLTSINILSNVSQQAMDQQPEEAKGMLQQISAQSKVIQQSMSDIVWSIRPDNDKVGDLLTRMREYASQTLEQLDIESVIEADDELAAKTLPMQYRKELLLIYKEAINNIARHAGATKVLVALKNGNKYLQLTIADNGKWKGASTGTGTRSMKERAKTMGGTLEIVPSATGTEVKAIIPVP
jgi:signal transduction histidine kinase/ligand-binding sensor domain-containing protein